MFPLPKSDFQPWSWWIFPKLNHLSSWPSEYHKTTNLEPWTERAMHPIPFTMEHAKGSICFFLERSFLLIPSSAPIIMLFFNRRYLNNFVKIMERKLKPKSWTLTPLKKKKTWNMKVSRGFICIYTPFQATFPSISLLSICKQRNGAWSCRIWTSGTDPFAVNKKRPKGASTATLANSTPVHRKRIGLEN